MRLDGVPLSPEAVRTFARLLNLTAAARANAPSRSSDESAAMDVELAFRATHRIAGGQWVPKRYARVGGCTVPLRPTSDE